MALYNWKLSGQSNEPGYSYVSGLGKLVSCIANCMGEPSGLLYIGQARCCGAENEDQNCIPVEL